MLGRKIKKYSVLPGPVSNAGQMFRTSFSICTQHKLGDWTILNVIVPKLHWQKLLFIGGDYEDDIHAGNCNYISINATDPDALSYSVGPSQDHS